MATTIYIPVNLTNPRVSTLAGNSFFNVKALTNYDAGVWEFVKDVDGKVYGLVRIPSNVSGTPNAALVMVCGWNATTGVARLSVKSAPPANGETLNATFTSETAQDITVPGTAYFRDDVTFTLTNAPSASDLLLVELFHEGAHGNDTVAVNTLLWAAYLQIDVG